MKIVIGITKLQDPNTLKRRAYKYTDIPDDPGWIDPEIYCPYPYDLIHMVVDGLSKEVAGWWNGEKWEGLRVKHHYKIIKWKRQITYD